MRLIEVLNKIANGELKEGTKVKWDVFEYTYKKDQWGECYLERKKGEYDISSILDDMYLRNLTSEVELIEPDHFTDVGKMAEHLREDTKMIEPTDNTKIEELVADEINGKSYAEAISIIGGKLNEVIRKLNKED